MGNSNVSKSCKYIIKMEGKMMRKLTAIAFVFVLACSMSKVDPHV